MQYESIHAERLAAIEANEAKLAADLLLKNERPFAFEDLPTVDVDPATGFASACKRTEPASWGPTYNIKRRRGQSVGDAVREAQRRELYACGKNIFGPVPMKYTVPRFDRRAMAAAVAADRRQWAMGQDIAVAYKAAMAAKRQRLASEGKWSPRDAFRMLPKPRYTMRAGELVLAEAA